MGYLNEYGEELRGVLDEEKVDEEAIERITKKVLNELYDSYKRGVEKGREGQQKTRPQKSSGGRSKSVNRDK